jgi:hypothetical protein
MSQFDYTKKLDIYAPMVLQSLLHTDEQGGTLKNSDLSDTQKLGKGYIEAIDGKNYLLDIKSANFVKFEKLTNAGDWGSLSQFVRNKSNQFPVKNRVTPKAPIKGAPNSQAAMLSWKEIQKGVFTSTTVKINTQQQEKISLLIFKNVLSSSEPNYKDFEAMFSNEPALSGPNGVFPKLRELPTWWNNYTLQFNEITTKPKFKNASYDVFLYDEPGNFMDYITQLVTKGGDETFGINFVTQKDTWDPADVWLLKTGAKEEFQAEINDPKKGLKTRLALAKINKTQAIQEVNKLLVKYYKAHKIVGVSLKKSNGVNLNYVEFNMNANEKDSDLPDVILDEISLNCTYLPNTHSFKSKTSYVFVNDDKEASYKLAYKSNTGAAPIGTSQGNITYEFLPSSKASAFLGKVPKESLKKWLTDIVNTAKLLPKGFIGPVKPIMMPQGADLPTTWNDLVRKKEEVKVKTIKSAFPESNILGLDKYVDNLEDSYTYVVEDNKGKVVEQGGLSDKNSSMMQMVDFTFILALMKNQEVMDTIDGTIFKKPLLQVFLTKSYYFAQKRGVKYNFGPFGKLY